MTTPITQSKWITVTEEALAFAWQQMAERTAEDSVNDWHGAMLKALHQTTAQQKRSEGLKR